MLGLPRFEIGDGHLVVGGGPIGDVDWSRFWATANETYTVTATGTGAEVRPVLDLADSCDISGTLGTTSRQVFVAPTTGWYYTRL